MVEGEQVAGDVLVSVWVTREGVAIPVEDLPEQHLYNITRYLGTVSRQDCERLLARMLFNGRQAPPVHDVSELLWSAQGFSDDELLNTVFPGAAAVFQRAESLGMLCGGFLK